MNKMDPQEDSLVGRLMSEQSRCWKQGEQVLVEFYRDQHPELQADTNKLLDLIYNEICLRERAGGTPILKEYVRRFPHLATPLRQQFEVHQALAEKQDQKVPGIPHLIVFPCTGCDKNLKVKEELAGKKVKCPNCGQVMRVSPVPAVPPIDEDSAPERTLPPKDIPSPDPGEVSTIVPSDSFTPNKQGQYSADRPGNPSTRPEGGSLDHEHESSLPTIPGYEVLGTLGRGGMGVVYKARHKKLRRVVALKMILAGGHAGEGELARFRTEAEAVARLQHPNIVQIYEIGEHDELPYFSLEFCPGGSLDKKVRGNPVPAREAAQLVEILAGAMQAAHQADIIHRDLKPANVLLTEDGTPKITDFGLAKKLDDAGQTQSGAIMGTPSYMAPEQAAGKAGELGPGADIYALGAILYELLIGRPPFKAATPLETILQVVSDDPVPPRQLQSKTPRDLETICLKCLHKEPRKRYGSAADLAEDLRRFQAGEPVQARPVGNLERGVKWVKRRPMVAVLLAAVVLVTLAGTGGIAWALNVALNERDYAQAQEKNARREKIVSERERKRAKENADKASANEKLARENEEKAKTNEKRAKESAEKTKEALEDFKKQKKVAENNWTRSEWKVYASNIAQAQAALQEHNMLLAEHYLDICRWDFRGWEHDYLCTLLKNQPTLKGHTEGVTSVAFSPDGKKILSAGIDLKMWDASSGQETLTFKGQTYGVRSVAFSPDGKKIISAGSGLKMWDVSSGQEIMTFEGHKDTISSLAFSPDGKKIVSASWDRTLKVWDASSDQEILTLKGHTNAVNSVAFSPDSTKIASASQDYTLKVWDASSGEDTVTLKGHTNAVTSVAFSPNGDKIVSGSNDRTLKVWDASTGTETLSLKGHTYHVRGVAFSPDGKKIVSASEDGRLKVWDAFSGEETLTLEGHAGINCVAFSPDGKKIVSGGWDKTLQVWPSAPTARGFSAAAMTEC